MSGDSDRSPSIRLDNTSLIGSAKLRTRRFSAFSPNQRQASKQPIAATRIAPQRSFPWSLQTSFA